MSQGHDAFSDENNPYRTTSAEAATPHHAGSPAEAIRHEHIKHEASVKSIGTLYKLGCIVLVLGSIVALVSFLAFVGAQAGPQEVMFVAGAAAFYLVIGCLQGFTAFGLWGLKPWARWVAVVLSVIGLIGFPVGTLICGYFLYLLLSAKGTMVFSDPYKEIILQTPHIKYKTSALAWILLSLLVGFLVFGVVALFFVG